jgi:hypothetical protein
MVYEGCCTWFTILVLSAEMLCGAALLGISDNLYDKKFGLLPKKNLFLRVSYSNLRHMFPEPKEQYLSPECEVLEIKPEGVIAASGDAPDMAPGWEWNF